MVFVDTIDAENWALEIKHIQVGEYSISGANKLTAQFYPNLPYVYTTPSQFKLFAEAIEKIYDIPETICGDKECHFNKTCQNLDIQH